MLDINSLRLTAEEYAVTLQQKLPKGFSYFSPQIIADAQLAKALWGVQAWIEKRGTEAFQGIYLSMSLSEQLHVAGIARPKDG